MMKEVSYIINIDFNVVLVLIDMMVDFRIVIVSYEMAFKIIELESIVN